MLDTIFNNMTLPWIKQGCIYITKSGSHSYGTNIETSDHDFKGLGIPPKEYYFGFNKKFEQAELHKPDTVIYEIKKFFSLASMANPSIIEVLFTEPADHLYISDVGKKLIEHRDKFLSKRVRFSFAGYSVSQLKRIKLHRKYFLNPLKAPPIRKDFDLPEFTLIPQDQLLAAEAEIKKELEKYQFDFLQDLPEPTKIAIKNSMTEMLSDLKISKDDQYLAAYRKIGFDDNFIELMQKERAYKNAKSEWDNYINWKTNRNPVRAAMEEKFGLDTKHAMHLVKLMRQCREILETGKVIVKRPDKDELISIRNGAWSYEKILEFAEREDKELQTIYEKCNILLKSPDINFLDKLCIELIEKHYEIQS